MKHLAIISLLWLAACSTVELNSTVTPDVGLKPTSTPARTVIPTPYPTATKKPAPSLTPAKAPTPTIEWTWIARVVAGRGVNERKCANTSCPIVECRLTCSHK